MANSSDTNGRLRMLLAESRLKAPGQLPLREAHQPRRIQMGTSDSRHPCSSNMLNLQRRFCETHQKIDNNRSIRGFYNNVTKWSLSVENPIVEKILSPSDLLTLLFPNIAISLHLLFTQDRLKLPFGGIPKLLHLISQRSLILAALSYVLLNNGATLFAFFLQYRPNLFFMLFSEIEALLHHKNDLVRRYAFPHSPHCVAPGFGNILRR